MNCIFCNQSKLDVLFQTNYFLGVWDIDPIQKGHLLIISKVHHMNISELSENELLEMVKLQSMVSSFYEENFDVLGTTSIFNNGNVMSQNTHFHFHVIPRYKNDNFYDLINPKQLQFDTQTFNDSIKKYLKDNF